MFGGLEGSRYTLFATHSVGLKRGLFIKHIPRIRHLLDFMLRCALPVCAGPAAATAECLGRDMESRNSDVAPN